MGHHITGGRPEDPIRDGSEIYDVAHHAMDVLQTWLVNESDQATSVLSQHLQDSEPGVLDARLMNHAGERCLELNAIGFSPSLGVLRFLHTLAEHSGVELVVLLCCFVGSRPC